MTDPTLPPGTRVILQGLRGAAHLNGRHGAIAGEIANDRYPVDLDLWDETSPNALGVRPANLKLEPAVPEDVPRASAAEGILEERYGRTISQILEATRFVAAQEFRTSDDVQDFDDIARLRQSPQGLLKLNDYIAQAWSHWGVVRERLREWAKMQSTERPDWDSLSAEDQAIMKAMEDAVFHPAAVAGWNVRVHGDFWIVSMDDEGTYVVAARANGAPSTRVYRVLGVLSALYPMILRIGNRPILMRLTMVPFYGRLVYDGVASPGGAHREPLMATVQEAERLFQIVEKSKAESRVIDQLRQLSVPGGSKAGLQDYTLDAASASGSNSANAPATAAETKLIKKILKLRVTTPNYWVMRRYGYTANENPNNLIVIMSHANPIHMFSTQSLQPTALEILQQMAAQPRRPDIVAIDDQACYRRLSFLLEGKPLRVDYYPPPSKEETAAAVMSGGVLP